VTGFGTWLIVWTNSVNAVLPSNIHQNYQNCSYSVIVLVSSVQRFYLRIGLLFALLTIASVRIGTDGLV